MKKFLAIFTVIVFLSSCSEYQKALKSEDVAVKFVSATKMYEAKKYNKAIRLFEQIAPAYKGKPSAEKMFYMYSQSLYKTEQYYLAGYQFESFVASYPKSEKIEEASFLGAKSFSFLSPVYSLDQTDTYKAVDKLQNYIDTYPEGQNMVEANLLTKKFIETYRIYYETEPNEFAFVGYDQFIMALSTFSQTNGSFKDLNKIATHSLLGNRYLLKEKNNVSGLQNSYLQMPNTGE